MGLVENTITESGLMKGRIDMHGVKLNRFIYGLARICRDHLLQEKWLIAPSLRVGYQWLDTVTRSGQATINVRVKTLKGMVLDIAAPEMARKGMRLVSNRGGAILVDRILNRLRKTSPSYLTSLPISPALSQTVYSSLKEMRSAAIRPEDLGIDRFEHPEKGAELSLILGQFLEDIRKADLIDYTDALDIARKSLPAFLPSLTHTLLLIPEAEDMSPLENVLIQEIPSEIVHWIPVDRPLAEPEDISGPLTNAEMLRWIEQPLAAPPARENDESVSIISATGEVNEIREVFRTCISKGISLDDVELVHTDSSTYLPLTYEVCRRIQADLPDTAEPLVTFAEGISATYSRPGRCLKAWVSWVRSDFSQSILSSMIDARLISVPDMESDGPSLETLSALFRRLGIGFGRDRYLEKIDELISGLEKQGNRDAPSLGHDDPAANRLELQLKTARVLRVFLQGLLSIMPNGDADSHNILESAKKLITTHARNVDEFDAYASRAILEEMTDMQRYVGVEDEDELSLDMWEWLSLLPDEVRVMGSGPRPGALHVSNLASGGHSARKYLFLVGLDDSRFPGHGYRDPVVLDSERERISSKLETASRRQKRKLAGFARLLARHRGSILLSYSCRDLLDDREKFPGTVIVSAFRIISGQREADQRDLLTWLSPPASFAPDVPDKSLNASDWWLSRICSAREIANPEELISHYFPHLWRGAQARENRLSTDFTVYDGKLAKPLSSLDPSSPDGPITSGSMLETAGRCPLAYFFRYVLRVEPPDEFALESEKWLDSLRFGSLLHEIFYTFVTETAAIQWPPIFDRDLPRMKEILNALASDYRNMYPPPSEDAFLEQRRELEQAARIFLREEERFSDRVPLYLEVSIGLKPYGNGSALDTIQPVRVNLPNGKTIRVRGRIDRIDEAEDGFCIVDYKSGNPQKYEDPDPFRDGRILQHALYIDICRAVLQEKHGPASRVLKFEYLFPGRAGQGLRLSYTPDELSEFKTLMQHMTGWMAAGSFLPTDRRDDCTFCDYVGVCGDVDSSAAASARKLANESNLDLRYFRGLRKSD
jgi:ATP-dependent helicase/nuclease subunit B